MWMQFKKNMLDKTKYYPLVYLKNTFKYQGV